MQKIYLFLFFLIYGNSALLAQLSPGDLHESHAFLEGIKNCTKCHSEGKKLDPQNCLNCHTLLKEQINKKAGLHARGEYSDCAKCHVDHIGRDYEMIYWGKGGKESFKHTDTGYILEGAHQKLDCEKCHNEKNILNPAQLLKKSKDLNRTHLGLGKQCLNCHRDEHRQQLDSNCLSCHRMNGWQKALSFEHNKTRYKLTGKHLAVKCESCHKIIHDDTYADDKSYLKFSINKFNSCQDCHKDIHKNRFGSNCTKCHNTSGWNNYNKKNFDHNSTNYPLIGKHRRLQCEQCHKPGKPMKTGKYKECMDCHSDAHRKQFVKRKKKGACEECHTVQGFSPSKYTLEMHQLSAYPLKGSHQAIPCLECHKKIKLAGSRNSFINFRFKNKDCNTCHEDVHKGETTKISGIESCENCHSINNWQEMSFDHDKTQFKLQGAHKKTECKKCHKKESESISQTWIFKNIKMQCNDCHDDIHKGQFNESNLEADCGKCHRSLDWLADLFDHEKDARFSLKGAHEFVKCSKCHISEEIEGKQVARYKPLNTRCESCHAGKEGSKL